MYGMLYALTQYRKRCFIHDGSFVAQQPSKHCSRDRILFDRIREQNCHFYAGFRNVITRNLFTV